MKKITLVALATGLAMAAVPANAAISIGYSTDGGTTITPVASGSGLVSWSGTIDGYSTAVNATGFPLSVQPSLLTNSLNVSTDSGAGSLLIYITQTGLSSYSGGLLSSFTSNVLSGSATSVLESTYIDTSNGLWGGALQASQLFTAIGAVADTTSVSATGPFSETAVYKLNFNSGAGSFNDTINIAAVPEPSTWGLMLLGFAGMGMVLRRRKSAIAQVA